jgi:hypothetical protein
VQATIAKRPTLRRQFAQSLRTVRSVAAGLRMQSNQLARHAPRVALLLNRPVHGLPLRASRQRLFPSISRSVSTYSIDSASTSFPVLLLKALQLAPVRYLHAGLFRAPLVERCITDLVLAAPLQRRQPSLVLIQEPDDLLLEKSASLMADSSQ